jgi:hypothetical protein
MNAMNAQTWNAAQYEKNARFVTDLGVPVLQLLAPMPNESIQMRASTCRTSNGFQGRLRSPT